VGRWVVTAIPQGWMFLHGFGIRQMSADPRAIVASVGLGEDVLGAESALPEYMEKQKQLIGQALKEPFFAGPQPTEFRGADEAFLFLVRHEVESMGTMTHVQTYARQGLWVGILTLTARYSDVAEIRPGYDAFVKGLNIAPSQAPQPVPAASVNANSSQPAASLPPKEN